jgi:hypothetical protein
MPVVPDVNVCYVMPAGACETLPRTARVSRARAMRPCKSACECACVWYVPPAAEMCVCRGSRVRAGCVGASWMLGVSGGWPLGHPAELVGVKLLHEVSALQVAAGDVHHRRAGRGDAARPVGCGRSHPARHPAGM